jgi:tRNA(adenine34) deaminase
LTVAALGLASRGSEDLSGKLFDGTKMPVAELHDRFMQEALAQARLAADIGEVPVGAVVVAEDQIIASAHNRRECDQDPTAHAELLAIRRAAAVLGSWRLDGCTVYVTLEPCSMCAGAMVLARLQCCVYGTTDPKGGFVGTLGDLSDHPGLNHRFQVVPGVRAQESATLLKEFFRQLRERRG